MRLLAFAVVANLVVISTQARAEQVEVRFQLPADYAEAVVSWSATPLDLPEGADMFAAMVMQPDPAAGPWVVFLDPGTYQITAYSEADLFETTVTISTNPAQDYDVPPLVLERPEAFRCDTDAPCDYKDDGTGLIFTLPGHWAAEMPFRLDLGGGQLADEISAIFYQDVDTEGGGAWFLNPVEWGEGDISGPCEDVPLGQLCTFDKSDQAMAAFAILAPSLRISEN